MKCFQRFFCLTVFLAAISAAVLLVSCGNGNVSPAPDADTKAVAPESAPEKPADAAPASAPETSTKADVPPAGAGMKSPVESNESKEADSAPAAAAVTSPEKKKMEEGKPVAEGREVATLGGGCFWCTEAVMERLEGVTDVISGYMGGHVENPTYEQICTKTTGHAEVIEVTFDPNIISFEEILDVFWQAHDPTTLNQQGADKGPQYRSVIFYHSPQQRNIAMQSMKKLNESGTYPDPAVTEISEATKFWVAEEYHQNYYVQNKDTNPYCRVVISPKLKKLGME